MLRSILAYNFTPERLQMLKMVALLCKAQVKAVAREDMLQPVGYIAGIKGIAPVEEKYFGDEATEEMIFLCGFDRPTLDKLLVAIKKSKLQRIELKAMLTQHNATWSGLELLKEIAEEHEYMTKNKGVPMPDEHSSKKP